MTDSIFQIPDFARVFRQPNQVADNIIASPFTPIRRTFKTMQRAIEGIRTVRPERLADIPVNELAQAGYRHVIARNGDEYILLWKQGDIEIIFMN